MHFITVANTLTDEDYKRIKEKWEWDMTKNTRVKLFYPPLLNTSSTESVVRGEYLNGFVYMMEEAIREGKIQKEMEDLVRYQEWFDSRQAQSLY